ncbi:MAG: tetratricopeptide repeat protein [Deltaproteobacteria bacterium]|nr:tetratricopeptide repeat protein [Candidatus Anaeroferrophillus wilburensis]MBN2888240.1 tetratricopeptide repeat protein [Deltaproteobacteria bacterium]
MSQSTGFFSKVKNIFSKQQKSSRQSAAPTVEEYRRQIQGNPKNFRIRIKLADQLLSGKMTDEALTEYNTAAKHYVDHGFAPMAIALYKKITKIDPDHLDANLSLARIYQRENLYADAITYYQQAFEYYQKKRQPEKALGILEKIIDIAPDKEKFRSMLHNLFPEFQEAEKSIYSDIIVADETGKSRAAATVSDQDGDFFDLGAELSDDVSTLSDSLDSHQPGGNVRDDIGVEQIFQILKETFKEGREQSASEDVDQQKFHYNMALAYKELGMPEQALEESKVALNFTAFRIPTLLLRGRLYHEQGNMQESLSQFQQGLRERGLTRKDFMVFKYEMGLIFKELEDSSRALEAFREAASVDPNYEQVAQKIAALEADHA